VYGNIGANPQIDKIGIVECCDSFWLLNFVLLIGVLERKGKGDSVALIALIKGSSWLMLLWWEVVKWYL
jgi:hypothetical protein